MEDEAFAVEPEKEKQAQKDRREVVVVARIKSQPPATLPVEEEKEEPVNFDEEEPIESALAEIPESEGPLEVEDLQ